MILNAKNYGDFKRELSCSQCRLCELSQARTHIVVDRGNPKARVLVLGEAPGKNEDLQARAFIGKAGKTFDSYMRDIGIDTDRDFLICNTVKCRPPDNRRPKAQELAACRPYLQKQIELVCPELIILMGSTALEAMTGTKKFSMKDETGKFFKLTFGAKEYDAMVLYHPAALIYNRKLFTVMQQHLQLLKTFLQQKNIFPKQPPPQDTLF